MALTHPMAEWSVNSVLLASVSCVPQGVAIPLLPNILQLHWYMFGAVEPYLPQTDQNLETQ